MFEKDGHGPGDAGAERRLNRVAWVVSVLATLALMNGAVHLPVPLWLRTCFVLVLTVLLPGYLLVEVWWQEDGLSAWEWLLYTTGAGYVVQAVVVLLLSYLPGGLARWQAHVAFSAVVLGLVALLWYRQRAGWRWAGNADGSLLRLGESERTLLWMGLAVLFGAAVVLRFGNLGYAEFHGDEARAALRAAAVIQGYEDVLMLHQKGPGEILVPTAIFVLAGQLDELSTRIPFAVASVVAIVGVMVLGWRMVSLLAGWVAALVLVFDGYLVAFARFVQYQSVVVLLSLLAVLATYRVVRSRRMDWGSLSLPSALLATALLFHYDGGAAVIPVVLLVLWWAWREGTGWPRLVSTVLVAVVTGGVLLAIFYVPYVLHPHFQATSSYLVDVRMLADPGYPYNNLPEIFEQTTIYSSSYYAILVDALLLAAVVVTLWRSFGMWAWLVLALLLGTTAAMIGAPGWLRVGDADLTFAPFALALVLVWLAPRQRAEERILWLWFGVPLLIAGFFFARPQTHIYVYFVPRALLIGVIVAEGWAWLHQRAGVGAAVGAGAVATAAVVAVFGYHSYLYLVYNQVEVLRTWEENHPRFYWTPYDKVDVQSLYGFPLRSGWKVVGSLYDSGVLDGDFETNQISYWVMGWYTRARLRCAASADSYFLIDPLHPWSEDTEIVEERLRSRGYVEWGRVTVRGEPGLVIYRRGSEVEPNAPVQSFALEDYAAAFDASVSPYFALDYPIVESRIGNPLHVNLGDQVWLEGYDLEMPEQLLPGDTFRLRLYWRAQKPFERDYKVFNQVVNGEGFMAAQRDGHPVCDRHVTTRWLPGALITDVYELEIAEDAPPGVYPLNTGMYLEENFERLEVLDESGNAINNQVHVADIVVNSH